MRTLRLSLTGMFILMLLGGGAVTAAETDESALAGEPIVVTGTLECLGDAPATTETAGSTEAGPAADGVVNLHRWVASDPRLEGEVSYTGTWQLYSEPAEDSGLVEETDAAIYSIVNEGGSWLCEETRTSDPPRIDERHTLIFDGQGEYEGLTAYLQVDWSQTPYTFSGLILPGEEPPHAEPQG
jgi:hypothetical protein